MTDNTYNNAKYFWNRTCRSITRIKEKYRYKLFTDCGKKFGCEGCDSNAQTPTKPGPQLYLINGVSFSRNLRTVMTGG